MKKETEHAGKAALMRSREILLADGRYMIFYTFACPLSEASYLLETLEPSPDSEILKKKDV